MKFLLFIFLSFISFSEDFKLPYGLEIGKELDKSWGVSIPEGNLYQKNARNMGDHFVLVRSNIKSYHVESVHLMYLFNDIESCEDKFIDKFLNFSAYFDSQTDKELGVQELNKGIVFHIITNRKTKIVMDCKELKSNLFSLEISYY